jgi:hypothetical protein
LSAHGRGGSRSGSCSSNGASLTGTYSARTADSGTTKMVIYLPTLAGSRIGTVLMSAIIRNFFYRTRIGRSHADTLIRSIGCPRVVLGKGLNIFSGTIGNRKTRTTIVDSANSRFNRRWRSLFGATTILCSIFGNITITSIKIPISRTLVNWGIPWTDGSFTT